MTRRVTLWDGHEGTLRPITPEDADELVAGFKALSNESRHSRFLAYCSTLNPEMVQYLTNVDGVRHLAWVLTVDDPSAPKGARGVGVARCVREHEDDEEAEFACTVSDAWQGHGVGRLLMEEIAGHAWEVGIRRLRGVMLVDNRRMQRVMEQIGDEVERHIEDAGIVSVAYEIHPPEWYLERQHSLAS